MPPRGSAETDRTMWSGLGCSRVRRWLWAVGKNLLRVTATASIPTQADVQGSDREDRRVCSACRLGRGDIVWR
jgi:hypothetical protein